MIGVLKWPGVICERDFLARVLTLWGDTPGLGFVDAYLAIIAQEERCEVLTINAREFARLEVTVPHPLTSPQSRN